MVYMLLNTLFLIKSKHILNFNDSFQRRYDSYLYCVITYFFVCYDF